MIQEKVNLMIELRKHHKYGKLTWPKCYEVARQIFEHKQVEKYETYITTKKQ